MENIVDDLIDELSHERYIIKVKYLVNEYITESYGFDGMLSSQEKILMSILSDTNKNHLIMQPRRVSMNILLEAIKYVYDTSGIKYGIVCGRTLQK